MSFRKVDGKVTATTIYKFKSKLHFFFQEKDSPEGFTFRCLRQNVLRIFCLTKNGNRSEHNDKEAHLLLIINEVSNKKKEQYLYFYRSFHDPITLLFAFSAREFTYFYSI